MEKILSSRYRHIIPFRFGDDDRSKRNYFDLLDGRSDQLGGKWREVGLNEGGHHLYAYILNSFRDRGKLSPGNIGAFYRYAFPDDEEYFSASLGKINFCITDIGIVLFSDGIGFLWYEYGRITSSDGREIDANEFLRFHSKLKSYGSESSSSCMINVSDRLNSHDEWVHNTLDSACPSATVFSSTALIFCYEAFDKSMVTYDELGRLAYYHSKGYDVNYSIPDDYSDNLYLPFKNVAMYASKEGVGYYACADYTDSFFMEEMPQRIGGDYFLLFLLALNQQYAVLRFAESISDELPAFPQAYLSEDLYIDIIGTDNRPHLEELLELERKVTRITTEINVFFAKNVRSSVSFVEHQDRFYQYVTEKLNIENDLNHLMRGLHSLQDILRDVVERHERLGDAEEIDDWRRETAYKKLEREKVALQNELYLDEPTGLYNKRGLNYYGRLLYSEAKTQQKSLLVCVADMNGLKFINDNFGHEEGDKAILGNATIIKNAISEDDYAFRQGGDEFMILGLRDHDYNADEEFATRLEEAMQSYNDNLGETRYRVEISFGFVVSNVNVTGQTLDELIKLADDSMYEMKKARDKHQRD